MSTSHPTTTNQYLNEIRQRANAARPAPWFWRGNTDVHQLRLTARTPGHGENTIMDFVRWGMRNAQPRWNRQGLMERIPSIQPIYEVCPTATDRNDPRIYRADIIGLRHPDAEFIARALRAALIPPGSVVVDRAKVKRVLRNGNDLADRLDTIFIGAINDSIARSLKRDIATLTTALGEDTP